MFSVSFEILIFRNRQELRQFMNASDAFLVDGILRRPIRKSTVLKNASPYREI